MACFTLRRVANTAAHAYALVHGALISKGTPLDELMQKLISHCESNHTIRWQLAIAFFIMSITPYYIRGALQEHFVLPVSGQSSVLL